MNETDVIDYSITNIRAEGSYYKNTMNKFIEFIKEDRVSVEPESSIESFKVLEAFRLSFKTKQKIFIK